MKELNDKHDGLELLKVERDIVSLYHRYAESTDFLDMVEFEDLYQMPYWEYLNVQGVELRRSDFICEGCLMLIMRIAERMPRTLSDGDRQKIDLCRNAIQELDEGRDRVRTLKFLALQLLHAVEQGRGPGESLLGEIVMVENQIMLEYFRRMAGKLTKSSYTPPHFEQQNSLEKFVQQAEQAFQRAYDALSGTEAAAFYNECKESLAEAIALARSMGSDEQVRELEKKRDQYKEIFREQFG